MQDLWDAWCVPQVLPVFELRSMSARYIRSAQREAKTIVHDTWTLSEQCNTDDIADVDRRYPTGEEVTRKTNSGEWAWCAHCRPRTLTKAYVAVRFTKADGSALSTGERARLAKSLDGIAKRQGYKVSG